VYPDIWIILERAVLFWKGSMSPKGKIIFPANYNHRLFAYLSQDRLLLTLQTSPEGMFVCVPNSDILLLGEWQ